MSLCWLIGRWEWFWWCQAVVEDWTPLKGRNYAATSLRWLNHVTCLLDEMPTRKSHTNNQSTIWCLEKARSDKTPPKYKTCYVVLYDSVMDPTISSQFTSKSTLKQSTTLAKSWSEREHQRQKGPTEEQSAQTDGWKRTYGEEEEQRWVLRQLSDRASDIDAIWAHRGCTLTLTAALCWSINHANTRTARVFSSSFTSWLHWSQQFCFILLLNVSLSFFFLPLLSTLLPLSWTGTWISLCEMFAVCSLRFLSPLFFHPLV